MTKRRHVPQRSEKPFRYPDVVAGINSHRTIEPVTALDVRARARYECRGFISSIGVAASERNGIHDGQTGLVRELAGAFHLTVHIDWSVGQDLHGYVRLLEHAV